MRRFLRETVENFRIAARSLIAHRLRTGLSLLGVGIGVATLLAIVGIIQGLDASFASGVEALGASTISVSRRPMLMFGDWWKFRSRPPITTADLNAVRDGVSSAAAFAPSLGEQKSIRFGGNEVLVSVTGTTEAIATIRATFPKVGRFLSPLDGEYTRRVVVIGAEVADQLFGSAEASIGHEVELGRQRYSVIGVLERKGKFLGESLDLSAYIPIETFRNDLGGRRSIRIDVMPNPGVTLDALEDDIRFAIRRSRGLPPSADDNFSLNRLEQLNKVYKQLTQALYGVATGIGLITLIVGGIGIMNIMLVSVRERTREIGVRRALGARRRTIVGQFLIESLAVSIVGGMGGTAFGLSVAWLVGQLTPLAAAVTPSAVVGGFLFSVGVGVLFGSWPAWSASRLDPIEALRHE